MYSRTRGRPRGRPFWGGYVCSRGCLSNLMLLIEDTIFNTKCHLLSLQEFIWKEEALFKLCESTSCFTMSQVMECEYFSLYHASSVLTQMRGSLSHFTIPQHFRGSPFRAMWEDFLLNPRNTSAFSVLLIEYGVLYIEYRETENRAFRMPFSKNCGDPPKNFFWVVERSY